MSALAGRWNYDGKPDASELCGRMLAAQRIYGPHHVGRWADGDVAVGRGLFRILAEDEYDRQPLVGGGGRFVLVADVRLDNREELGGELGIDPAAMRRLADAGFLLAAWERWEDACFDRLLGDYAFALWDARDRRLVLARDPMGTRPLHYHLGRGFAAFASMPKGLHALPDIPYAPDEVRQAEFLAIMPEYGPRSFFKDICRVESGHAVSVTPAGAVARRHWQPRRETLKLAGQADYAEGLRHHLDRAVEARLRGSDGRIGAHLSAGFDSSAVAATAARLTAAAGGKVVAFTSAPREGYEGPLLAGVIADESEMARETAALYPNIEHVLVRPDGRTVLDDLDRDFFLYERPLVNAENQRWWNSINAEAQKRKLKVMLTGVMGNFTISYAGWESLPEMVVQRQWLRLFREGRALVRAGRAKWKGVLATSFGPWVPEPLWNALVRAGQGWNWNVDTYTAVNRDRLRELDMARRARSRGFDLSYRPRKNSFDFRLWCLHRVDLGNNNKGALGGWGIDLRDPTTDRRLIEYCLSVPSAAYLSDGSPRALGMLALADRLPANLLQERRKGLQAVDWHEGLTASRDRLREEISRLEQVPAAAAALDLERMRALIEKWPTANWNSHRVMRDYRMALLRGVVSGHFLRKASRSNA